MARPRSCEKPVWRNRLKCYAGRIRGEDGKRTPFMSLGTTDEEEAMRRLRRWQETFEPPVQPSRETFEKASTRIVTAQLEQRDKQAPDRMQRLRKHAFPRIGKILVGDLRMPDLYGVLESMARADYSESAIHHMRTDFSRVLGRLVLEGAIVNNVARGMGLPEEMLVDDRPHLQLTDAETREFLARQGTDNELGMMVLVSRCLGGQRTSDLHAFDWSGVDTAAWQSAQVRRPKTEDAGAGRKRKGRRRGPKRTKRSFEWARHEIPQVVKAPLEAWWRAQGCPKSGPVFPLRKGPNAGQRKTGKGISYVQAFRDALWRVGIHRPLPGYHAAAGDARRQYCALQVETDESRPVIFHGLRSAYVTALNDAGLNALQAAALAGHSDLTTHQGYYRPELLTAPETALLGGGAPTPVPPSPPAPKEPAGVSSEQVLAALMALVGGAGGFALRTQGKPPTTEHPADTHGDGNPAESMAFDWRAHVDSNHRPTAPETEVKRGSSKKPANSLLPVVAHESPLEGGLPCVAGQTPSPLQVLGEALSRAVAEGNTAAVVALAALVETERARVAPPAPVVSLAEARAKRRR